MPSSQDIISLCHTTGWGLSEIDEMSLSEIGYWCSEVATWHKEMNKAIAAGREKR